MRNTDDATTRVIRQLATARALDALGVDPDWDRFPMHPRKVDTDALRDLLEYEPSKFEREFFDLIFWGRTAIAKGNRELATSYTPSTGVELARPVLVSQRRRGAAPRRAGR